MKRIAKSRPGRLASALAAAAATVRRTIAGRSRSRKAQATTRTQRSLRADGRLETALIPAHAGHFAWIAASLREGAAQGSFDPELATDSLPARVFFENLRQALETGYFLSDRGEDAPAPTAASAYLFTVVPAGRAPIPVGFAIFKSIGALGFELWLCGIERRYRGRGLCTSMLAAARQTPAGMLAQVARVNRTSRDCAAICRALERSGYRSTREGPHVRWFVREDAPETLKRLVREGRAGRVLKS